MEKRNKTKAVPQPYDYASLVAATAVKSETTKTTFVKNEVGVHVLDKNIAKKPRDLSSERLASMKDASSWSAFRMVTPESSIEQD